MIDSAFSPPATDRPRHRAEPETSEPREREHLPDARRRLLSLMEDASGRSDGAGPVPDSGSAGSRPPDVLVARTSRAGRLVRRWLPESWLRSRVDPGRAGLLGVGVLAALAAVAVALVTVSSRPEAQPVPPLPVVASVAATTSTSAAPDRLVISMVGRVHDPGLVTVEPGARVADALHAAGGPLPDTDVLSLNLARKLVDGEQLYVGVPTPPGARTRPQPVGGAPGGSQRKVNLNTADKQALEELPGIGPVTAQRIVQWRTDNGGFDSVEQLRAVNGIGEVKYSRLQDLVRV